MVATILSFSPSLASGPRISGREEVVFDWKTDRCETWDIPDAPARAWRDADGQVRMVTGNEQNRLSSGPSLDELTRSCPVVHRGAEADDPGAYDDRSWIAAIHTRDGRAVEALAHVEYHGHRRPERCEGAYSACWRNAVVALRSDDGGETFLRSGSEDLVAALPYAYSRYQTRRAGYFNPSNIIEHDGYLYVFVFAERFEAQRRGACLLRRALSGSAQDWRGWDGRAFTVAFADPYRSPIDDPSRHVCTPVPNVASTISSVVHHAPSGRFLAVTPTARRDRDGVERSGIYWMESTDLLHWSVPELLHEVPLLWRHGCSAPTVHAYPSLLDTHSPSRNFDVVGPKFWLYLVEMRLGSNCKVGPDRDLVRLPVSWPLP
jgi:hypothetical protein